MQRDVKCPQCGALFGKEISIERDGSRDVPILTIKNRDLYRTFRGGRVSGPCRGCGATVQWPEV